MVTSCCFRSHTKCFSPFLLGKNMFLEGSVGCIYYYTGQ